MDVFCLCGTCPGEPWTFNERRGLQIPSWFFWYRRKPIFLGNQCPTWAADALFLCRFSSDSKGIIFIGTWCNARRRRPRHPVVHPRYLSISLLSIYFQQLFSCQKKFNSPLHPNTVVICKPLSLGLLSKTCFQKIPRTWKTSPEKSFRCQISFGWPLLFLGAFKDNQERLWLKIRACPRLSPIWDTFYPSSCGWHFLSRIEPNLGHFSRHQTSSGNFRPQSGPIWARCSSFPIRNTYYLCLRNHYFWKELYIVETSSLGLHIRLIRISHIIARADYRPERTMVISWNGGYRNDCFQLFGSWLLLLSQHNFIKLESAKGSGDESLDLIKIFRK